MISNDIIIVFLQSTKKYSHHSEKKKSERRCRDVKTQKACKQGWEPNIGPKIKQTTSI